MNHTKRFKEIKEMMGFIAQTVLPAQVNVIPYDDPKPKPTPANARAHIEALGKKPALGWFDERPRGSVDMRNTDVRRTWERVKMLSKPAVDYRKPRRVK